MILPLSLKNASLLPHELSSVSVQAVAELLHEGQSVNTLRSYQSALQYWAAWYALRYGASIELPVPATCVLQFIVDHAQRSVQQGLAHELPAEMDARLVAAGYKGKPGPLAHNTLVHRVAVLSKAHQARGVKNPCQDPKVRELLSRTRKAYAKRGELPQKKAALTKDLLRELLNTCDTSLRGKRDRALLLFAWASGGRRRSEVASADMKFLQRLGPGKFQYELVHSKTNQSGLDRQENFKPVLGAAGEALEIWLAASGIQHGALFRRVLKGGHLGQPLSAAAVRDIVKQRCSLAGLEGKYSAHSLRSGFVTEAVRQQIPLPETMAMTGHKSVASVVLYARGSAWEDTLGAKLADGL